MKIYKVNNIHYAQTLTSPYEISDTMLPNQAVIKNPAIKVLCK